MRIVNTTLGEIDTDQIGVVDVHEHVILDGLHNPYIPDDFHHIDVDLITPELLAWKKAGGGVIVDSSPIGVGRSINLLTYASKAANLPLIAASGFHKLSYYSKSHWLISEPEDKIHEILLAECTEGILFDDCNPFTSARSNVKAGILKLGVDANGFSPILLKALASIGKTMERVKVNCMIHTEPGVPFVDLLRNLNHFNFSPNRVIFCHMGKSLDKDLHTMIAREGYYLEFDEMVRPTPTLSDLAKAILSLFSQGFGQSILFAGDLARRSYWSCYGGKPGLPYLISGLQTELYTLGLSDEMLNKIWVRNPRRYFCES